MSNIEPRTFEALVAGLETMMEFIGENEEPITVAKHGIIIFNCTTDDIPEGTEEGEHLVKLGFFVEDEDWCWEV